MDKQVLSAKEVIAALSFDYDPKADRYIEKTGYEIEEALVCLKIHIMDPKPQIHCSLYTDNDWGTNDSFHDQFTKMVLENSIYESLAGEARPVVKHQDTAINQEEDALYQIESGGKDGPWKLKGRNSFVATFNHDAQDKDIIFDGKLIAKAGDHLCMFYQNDWISHLYINVSEEIYEANRNALDRLKDPQLFVRIYFRGWSIRDLDFPLRNIYPDWVNTKTLKFIGHEAIGKVYSVTLQERSGIGYPPELVNGVAKMELF